MATEKINLTAPVEPVGNSAEDTQTASTCNNALDNGVEQDSDDALENMSVTFADEEAALAAQEAGLEIGEETDEEQIASEESNDNLSNLDEEALVELFAAKIEAEPVQTLRPVVEAIKI